MNTTKDLASREQAVVQRGKDAPAELAWNEQNLAHMIDGSAQPKNRSQRRALKAMRRKSGNR